MAFSKFILLLQINNAFLFQDNRFNSISLERKIKMKKTPPVAEVAVMLKTWQRLKKQKQRAQVLRC